MDGVRYPEAILVPRQAAFDRPRQDRGAGLPGSRSVAFTAASRSSGESSP